MIEVKFFSAEGAEAKPTYNGSIFYDDKRKTLISKPASSQFKNTLQFVLMETLITPDGDIYDPEEDPEGFINNLHLAYRSYGLTASKPEEAQTATQGKKAGLTP